MISLSDLLVYAQDHDAEKRRWEDLSMLAGGGNHRAFSVPGRVEIIGNHTDHAHGKVLAASINLDIIALAANTSDSSIIVHTAGRTLHIPLMDKLPPQANTSERLIKAMLDVLPSTTIPSFELWLDSKVPLGQGLSSSAAFCMLILEVITKLSGRPATIIELAQIAQQAEHAIEKPCGLMDQLACAHGGIIHIDFENVKKPRIQPVSFAAKDLRFVIVYTGSGHENINHYYAAIPEDMQTVSRFFSVDCLRKVDERDFLNSFRSLRDKLSDTAIMRAVHFFSENKRVDALMSALSHTNYSDIFTNIHNSSESSWRLLQNVIVEGQRRQDIAIALAASNVFCSERSQGACRVHGGGFSGSILVVLPENLVQDYIQYIEAILGEGSATELSIRPVGATEIDIS